MSINILMPALSPTMTEGKLAKWHVKVGDAVKSGQVVCEIETDKATMEVEAVDEGKVGQILVPEGTEGVKVNAVIAVLLEEGETAVPAGAAAPPPAAPTPQAQAAPAPAAPSPVPKPATAATAQPAAAPLVAGPSGERIFASRRCQAHCRREGYQSREPEGLRPRTAVSSRPTSKAPSPAPPLRPSRPRRRRPRPRAADLHRARRQAHPAYRDPQGDRAAHA